PSARYTLSLHDALPIFVAPHPVTDDPPGVRRDDVGDAAGHRATQSPALSHRLDDRAFGVAGGVALLIVRVLLGLLRAPPALQKQLDSAVLDLGFDLQNNPNVLRQLLKVDAPFAEIGRAHV